MKMNKTARLLESGIRAKLRICVRVEVAVLGSPSLTVHGFCGRKATLNLK